MSLDAADHRRDVFLVRCSERILSCCNGAHLTFFFDVWDTLVVIQKRGVEIHRVYRRVWGHHRSKPDSVLVPEELVDVRVVRLSVKAIHTWLLVRTADIVLEAVVSSSFVGQAVHARGELRFDGEWLPDSELIVGAEGQGLQGCGDQEGVRQHRSLRRLQGPEVILVEQIIHWRGGAVDFMCVGKAD